VYLLIPRIGVVNNLKNSKGYISLETEVPKEAIFAAYFMVFY
jgi:hypothetical protein